MRSIQSDRNVIQSLAIHTVSGFTSFKIGVGFPNCMRVTAILQGPRRLYALDQICDVADILHGRHYRGPALACPHQMLFSHL